MEAFHTAALAGLPRLSPEPRGDPAPRSPALAREGNGAPCSLPGSGVLQPWHSKRAHLGQARASFELQQLWAFLLWDRAV